LNYERLWFSPIASDGHRAVSILLLRHPSFLSFEELGCGDIGGEQTTRRSHGKPFTLVIHDPDSADMRYAIEKLFGVEGADVKPLLARLNEARKVVVIVDSDEELFRAVGAIPGAVGLVDVYSINSGVKVLRVDGKLPFDTGYALKGN
jgi:hypothetical protein